MVIWLVGLSGSGKSTVGHALYRAWKAEERHTVYLDGDVIRNIFRHEAPSAYTLEERKRNADRICELCLVLDSQGINVVCAILSAFEISREWNRRQYSKYFEAYIKVPMEVLRRRDVKGLYEAASRGEMKNVVGIDLPFEEPRQPDFVFENTRDQSDFSDIADELLKSAKAKIG